MTNWETVDQKPNDYIDTPKPDGYRLMGLNRIGVATVLYEYRGLGQFRIIEWGVHDGYGEDRGRVSHARTLEIGNAFFYAITNTLYSRAWGFNTRKRAKDWGILKGIQEEIPMIRGRSYDY